MSSNIFAKGDDTILEKAHRLADMAVSLDPADACSYRAVGIILMIEKQMDQAGGCFDRAPTLNPTDTFTVCVRGLWLAHKGLPDEALQAIDAGLWRDPFPPTFYWEFRGIALFKARRHREAIEAFSMGVQPPWWCQCYLTACYTHLDMKEMANSHAAKVLRLKPDFFGSGHRENGAL